MWGWNGYEGNDEKCVFKYLILKKCFVVVDFIGNLF